MHYERSRNGVALIALLAVSCSSSKEAGDGGAGAMPAISGAGGISGISGLGGQPSGGSGATGGVLAGTSGGAAGQGGVGGVSGTMANSGGGDPNTGGTSGPDDASVLDGSDEPSDTPILPPLDDPGDTGPFAIQVVESLEGLSTHILIAPEELGQGGIEHPVLVWINGAGASSSSYRNMHDNLAAQGFVIVDDKQSTFEAIPEIDSQRAAIDWVIAQTEDASSAYFGKLDAARIAIGGHSLGSVASFGNVADARIVTSVHIAGGVTGNPGGVDNALITALQKPTLFLCGSADANGLGRVEDDFAAAPAEVPLFFAVLDGVGHTDEFNADNGGRWGRIVSAWLRWQLADEASSAVLFMGDSCELCIGDWVAMKRGL
jgi:hypothetical protein